MFKFACQSRKNGDGRSVLEMLRNSEYQTLVGMDKNDFQPQIRAPEKSDEALQFELSEIRSNVTVKSPKRKGTGFNQSDKKIKKSHSQVS